MKSHTGTFSDRDKSMKVLTRLFDRYFVAVPVLFLILYRLPLLSIPFYYDEAWSYAMAVFDMHQTGPTLIPGHASEWYTRGHPLMYYFVSSCWLSLFGASLVSAHLFSLAVSCLSLVAVYYTLRHLVNTGTAVIAVLGLTAQSMFLAQSTMLLPEIWLMLFSVVAFWGYFAKRWLWFALAATVLVLSKETGLVLLAAFFFDKLILERFFIARSQTRLKGWFLELGVLSIPLAAFGGFLLLQKANLGYYFYPEHTGMMSLDIPTALSKLNGISRMLVTNGRRLWIAIALPMLAFLLLKRKVSSQHGHLMAFSLMFIAGYLLFSCVNFFTARYVLSILPFLFLILAYNIYQALANRLMLLIPVVTGLLATNSIVVARQDEMHDVHLTFTRAVDVYKQAVNYCEAKGWQHVPVKAGFLMSYHLQHPQLGYLEGNSGFTLVNQRDSNLILLFDCNEHGSVPEEVRTDTCLVLEKRFENGKAWVEVYRQLPQTTTPD